MRIIISFFILLSVHFCFGNSAVQSAGEKKLTAYKVQPKDTWTNLSKRFNTTIKELQSANVGVTDLKIGQIIQVPSSAASKETFSAQKEKPSTVSPPPGNSSTGKNPVYYTVMPHETLYRISVNNKVSVDDLKKWNGLTSNIVSVDQKLIVGYGTQKIEKVSETIQPSVSETKPAEIPKPKKTEVTEVKTPVIKKEKDARTDTTFAVKDSIPVTTSANKITETGVVSWFGDGDLNQNKFYALHRTVPIGTIIKVTNKMNNNSVFVKVVGALPTTGDNENIILKITQAAAQRIGALDQKFQAELSYAIAQ